ncbi:hypothetical protein FF011L_38170 [Roseimaritima multifibrata]|uniref:Uncharacterized protein n=1 Tax=Roseimaritima multifibrata TaxID=1930274 RepID=A0A517MJH9_9BACT|nr:hypothetical protein FF011L_38170 [Roseimaritima multifibrata]
MPSAFFAERRERLVDLVIVAFRSMKERSLNATFTERKATAQVAGVLLFRGFRRG